MCVCAWSVRDASCDKRAAGLTRTAGGGNFTLGGQFCSQVPAPAAVRVKRCTGTKTAGGIMVLTHFACRVVQITAVESEESDTHVRHNNNNTVGRPLLVVCQRGEVCPQVHSGVGHVCAIDSIKKHAHERALRCGSPHGSNHEHYSSLYFVTY